MFQQDMRKNFRIMKSFNDYLNRALCLALLSTYEQNCCTAALAGHLQRFCSIENLLKCP